LRTVAPTFVRKARVAGVTTSPEGGTVSKQQFPTPPTPTMAGVDGSRVITVNPLSVGRRKTGCLVASYMLTV
jgi:hypothetical protein